MNKLTHFHKFVFKFSKYWINEILATKKWLTQGLRISGLYYKCLTIVIYDRNDIGLYYKTRDDRNW